MSNSYIIMRIVILQLSHTLETDKKIPRSFQVVENGIRVLTQ